MCFQSTGGQTVEVWRCMQIVAAGFNTPTVWIVDNSSTSRAFCTKRVRNTYAKKLAPINGKQLRIVSCLYLRQRVTEVLIHVYDLRHDKCRSARMKYGRSLKL